LPALLRGAQTADDVVLRQIGSLLPLVMRLDSGSLRPYLEALEVAETTANSCFLP
jgi:hypothetical protein